MAIYWILKFYGKEGQVVLWISTGDWSAKWSQQRTDQKVFWVLALTLKLLALKKKKGFSPLKNTSQIFFDFFLPYSKQLFSADAIIFPKKKLN